MFSLKFDKFDPISQMTQIRDENIDPRDIAKPKIEVFSQYPKVLSIIDIFLREKIVNFCLLLPKKSIIKAKNTHIWKLRNLDSTPPPLI